MIKYLLVLFTLLLIAPHAVMASSNGVALTPPMGWSSWSSLRQNISESSIEAQGLGLSNNLKSHGFVYVNIDDGWYQNPGTVVDANGRWVPNATKFPSGIAALATYMHNLGLKFGIYLTPGIPVAAYSQNTPILGTNYHAQDIVSNTGSYENNYSGFSRCMYFIDFTKPGAQAFLNSWANQLASWGVDYVKLDGVGTSDQADVSGWSTALNQSGRAISLELSNSLDFNNGAFWRQYSNGWRIDGDIETYGSTLTSWGNVSSRFSGAPGWQKWAGAGGWDDLDSLEVGNGTAIEGLTADEAQSTETLWVLAASPLLLGTDMTKLSSPDLALLTNDGVLAIDQAGVPGAPLALTPSAQEVWRSKQPDGSYAVGLFNLAASSATASVNWSALGFSGPANVYDMWSQTALGQVSTGFSATLNTHASRLLKVVPLSPAIQYLADSSANSLSGGATPANEGVGTDGVKIGQLGNGAQLQFNKVMAGIAGTYDLTLLYYNGDSSRSATISVNGGAPVSYAFPTTGSNFDALGSTSFQVQLQAGANTISFSNASGYAPDIDSITLQSVVASASSQQVQGSAGTFSLPLNLTGSPTVEPRIGSTPGAYTIVVNFTDSTITSCTATLGLQAGQTGTATGAAQPPVITSSSSGVTATIHLTGVGNAQHLNLHLSAIQPGNGTADIPINILNGDVNQNGLVTTGDVNLIRAATGGAPTAQTFLLDVNCNGLISTGDVNLVRGLAGTSLP